MTASTEAKMKAGKGSVVRDPEVEAKVEEEWMDATRDEVGACLSGACGDADGWMERASERRTGRRVASAQPGRPWKKNNAPGWLGKAGSKSCAPASAIGTCGVC